jgi:hypothetical protein
MQFAGEQDSGLLKSSGCSRGRSAVFSQMGDYRSCLGATFFCGSRKLIDSYYFCFSGLSGSSWQCEAGYGAGHLVVRAAGPQGANVRQAANVEPRTAYGIKGRRLSTVSVSIHLRIAYARSPGRLSRRALSPSLAKQVLLRHEAVFSQAPKVSFGQAIWLF